jgi:hypothetical protein
MDIETGNAHDVETGGTGWFIGFSPWTRMGTGEFRHIPQDEPVTGLCVKWYHHDPGHASGPKPVSEGRTMSILVTDGSHFELDFSTTADFSSDVRTVVFRREGDFAAWGEGIFHRWRCIERATIGTVRWTPAK